MAYSLIMDYIEFSATITPLEIGREVLIAELSLLDFESFVETHRGIKAYIPSDKFNESNIQNLSIISNPDFTINYVITTIQDQNWNVALESDFKSILVDDVCLVRADFHEEQPVEYDIVINPQMSFGTGHHETTFLMIQQLLKLPIQGQSILDIGCGTGVLAILAAKKRAKYVEAIDIDEWAYNNTLENIKRNNCSMIVVKKGGVKQISDVSFNRILANINRNVLLQDIKEYSVKLKKSGILLLSGFFATDKTILLKECLKNGLEFVSEATKNDWMVLHLKKI